MSEIRKLAVILVADVVGYSRFAGAGEARTLARLHYPAKTSTYATVVLTLRYFKAAAAVRGKTERSRPQS
jgi:hypothetical protein